MEYVILSGGMSNKNCFYETIKISCVSVALLAKSFLYELILHIHVAGIFFLFHYILKFGFVVLHDVYRNSSV